MHSWKIFETAAKDNNATLATIQIYSMLPLNLTMQLDRAYTYLILLLTLVTVQMSYTVQTTEPSA